MTVSEKCHQSGCETEKGRTGRDGENKLIGEFKMATGDVISISGYVMEYMYIPTGIKRELVRFGMDCDRKGSVFKDSWRRTSGHSF